VNGFGWADVGWTIGAVALFIAFITSVVLALTYAERKVIARIQQRIGPMRTGPFGLLQPIADALKLLTKEDLTPGRTDKLIFWLAPLVVFVPAFVIWVSIPFTRNLVIENLEYGILFVIAVSSVSTAGLLMAGWGSANKYAVLGALRAGAQLISYELPMVFAALGVVAVAQSADLQAIVGEQDAIWYIVLQPAAFVLFLLSGLAEVGRAPFDIPVAESEVVGGPMVEYSGIHWGMFFLAEYANTFAVAALTTLLFLGGWRGPAPDSGIGQDVMQAFWFAVKTCAVIVFIFWLRATVPRLRIDQLMALAWKALVPLSLANLVVTSFYLFYDWPDWTVAVLSLALLAGTAWVYYRTRRARLPRPVTIKVPVRQGRIVA
jgi:NADH-quinone oxidoreductase subunit H